MNNISYVLSFDPFGNGNVVAVLSEVNPTGGKNFRQGWSISTTTELQTAKDAMAQCGFKTDSPVMNALNQINTDTLIDDLQPVAPE